MLGRPDEALRTLSQDEEAELLNPTLLYEKCLLLHNEGRMDEFVPKAELLFSRHFVKIRNKEEMRAVSRYGHYQAHCSSQKEMGIETSVTNFTFFWYF